MKKSLLTLGLVFFFGINTAHAVDGVYLGAEVGAEGISASSSSSTDIVYGGDLGVRVNPLFDVVARVMHSSHFSTQSLTSTALAADFRILQINDFEVAVGAGPGFYFSSASGLTDTKFGLNYGGNVDVVMNETIHLGVGGRFHQVFSGTNYWNVTMRVGFLFNAG